MLGKATRYALYAATDMAAARGAPVSVEAVARRWAVPAAACAKAIQRLVRAGIAQGTRGAKGGYRLAKRPSRVTVADVLEVFERPWSGERCALRDGGDPRACTGDPRARLMHLVHEVDDAIRCTFASVTLAILAGLPPEIPEDLPGLPHRRTRTASRPRAR